MSLADHSTVVCNFTLAYIEVSIFSLGVFSLLQLPFPSSPSLLPLLLFPLSPLLALHIISLPLCLLFFLFIFFLLCFLIFPSFSTPFPPFLSLFPYPSSPSSISSQVPTKPRWCEDHVRHSQAEGCTVPSTLPRQGTVRICYEHRCAVLCCVEECVVSCIVCSIVLCSVRCRRYRMISVLVTGPGTHTNSSDVHRVSIAETALLSTSSALSCPTLDPSP